MPTIGRFQESRVPRSGDPRTREDVAAKLGLLSMCYEADTDSMARAGTPDRFDTIGSAVDWKGR